MASSGANAVVPQFVAARYAAVAKPGLDGQTSIGWHHAVFRKHLPAGAAPRRPCS